MVCLCLRDLFQVTVALLRVQNLPQGLQPGTGVLGVLSSQPGMLNHGAERFDVTQQQAVTCLPNPTTWTV